ncbi:MAG: DUF4097 family beta strand repeat-containing protein [bacterium]
MKQKRFTIWVVILVFGSVGLLMASTVKKEFKKRFDFAPGGEVSVKNVNGNICLEPWDEESVEVYAEIEVKAGSRREAEAFMEKVEIVIDHGRGRLSVETDYPKSRGGDSIWDAIFRGGRKPQVKVDFWIKMPSRTNLIVKSVNGRVEARDVEGKAELSTTNGQIQAEGMRGSVDAHTTNGGIRVELTEFDSRGQMSFKTTNGSITVTLPEDVKADIEVSTVNGGVSTDFPVEVRGKFIGKRIRGTINGGGGLIDLHTVNGSIRIYER